MSSEKDKPAFIMDHKDTKNHYDKLHRQRACDQKMLKLRGEGIITPEEKQSGSLSQKEDQNLNTRRTHT